jgi:hypothetical protein
MRNAMVSGNGAVPAGCRVLLAIDTFTHAYALDFGIGKHLGIAAQFENLEWPMIAARLDVASPPLITLTQTFGEDQHDPQAVQLLPPGA